MTIIVLPTIWVNTVDLVISGWLEWSWWWDKPDVIDPASPVRQREPGLPPRRPPAALLRQPADALPKLNLFDGKLDLVRWGRRERERGCGCWVEVWVVEGGWRVS